MARHWLKSEIKTAGPSPELKSNIVYYFTWQWLQPFINLGNKKPIQMEDMYDLLPREKTEYCERIWNKCWDKEMSETGKPPTLWKLMVVSAGREMLYSLFACPVWLASLVAQVFILKTLIIAATQTHLPWWRGFLLVLGMWVTAIFHSLAQHYTLTAGQRSGLKMKSAVSMAIFNKMMALKTVALGGTSSGQLLNLIMNDTQKIMDAATYLAFTCFSIIDCLVVGAIAIGEIGVSALPGVLIIICALFLLIATAQGVGNFRKQSVKVTDARVRTVQEILSGIRVVKYNGWTNAFLKRIEELRLGEMVLIEKGAFLRGTTSTLKDGVAPVAALVTFTANVFLNRGNLSAATAFTILGLYSILVRVYSISPFGALAAWETKIAMKRLKTLLDLPEGNSSTSEEKMEQIRKIYPGASVAVSEGTFTWYVEHGENAEDTAHIAGKANLSKTKQTGVAASSGKRASNSGLKSEKDQHKLATLQNINMAVTKGKLTAIIGAVGSGKSSLLHAILAEMEVLKGGFLIDGTVSYAPQQPWIINDSIKNNIIFANEFDEARYQQIVSACALDHDIKTMPAGHNTEIGEKGVNLSGGQKARISLARACYHPSEVVLLDDPLAAVDVPTARHLMEHVLNGVLKGRTVILVTHNRAALELCDKTFLMKNGELKEVQLEEEVMQNILQQATKEQDVEEKFSDAEEPLESVHAGESSEASEGQDSNGDSAHAAATGKEGKAPTQSFGALTVQEDRMMGEVTWKTYLDFCRGSGLWLWGFVIFFMCVGQAIRVTVDVWIAVWVNHKYHLTTYTYLWTYCVVVVFMVLTALARAMLFTEAMMQAARSMHRAMAESVLRSPQLFFDQNPVGRIMNRFGKDQSLVDEALPVTAQIMTEYLIAVVGVVVLVGAIMPYFLIILPPFMFLLWFCQRRYVAVSRELKRLEGLSRSPIYDHFSQALTGVISVRAYGVQTAMHDHFRHLLDANNRAIMMSLHAARWLGFRLDFGAACCLAVSALLSVLLRHKINPGLIGLVLIQALQLTGFLQYGIRMVADTENIFVSVERNQAYSRLPSEADPKSPPGLISDEWPEKGKVEFVDYTMSYRVDLPPVLNNLTFMVYPQEKIGILGRTGAGKSSLAAALFRMVENTACSGNIFIDDLDIKLVGLDDLRLRLSIIPQDPVLFRGTVRLNLDPFELHDDKEIHEALQKVELIKKIKSMDAGLDSTVAENGENFSVGQRQLLCLARSLLRKSRIIVMDEATAAVDGETDQLIQKTMKTVFHDCTVMTIAHRIDTVIDCDRVLVLAKGGQIAEFDSPLNLLRRTEQESSSDTTATQTEHVFADMVSQAGPVLAKQLREAAEAAEKRRTPTRRSKWEEPASQEGPDDAKQLHHAALLRREGALHKDHS